MEERLLHVAMLSFCRLRREKPIQRRKGTRRLSEAKRRRSVSHCADRSAASSLLTYMRLCVNARQRASSPWKCFSQAEDGGEGGRGRGRGGGGGAETKNKKLNVCQ